MKPKVLLSWFYYRTKKNLTEWLASLAGDPLVFLDSGAFSAHQQGVPIDVREYGAWLVDHRHLFTAYANLDVVGDAKATARNQAILEDEFGLAPLPVFHGGEPWSALEALLERHRYVCLGGMVASNDDVLWRWLTRCFLMARDAGAVYHGFGQTRRDVIASFPWYSVDSSSWGSGHRYGHFALWDDRARRLLKVPLYDREAIYKVADLIRDHGRQPEAFASRKGFHREPVIAVSALAWMRWEEWLRQRHGAITLPDADPGLLLYLAGGGCAGTELKIALDGLHLYLADGSPENLSMAASAVAS